MSWASVDLPVGIFEDQIAEIADRVTTLDAALDALAGGSTPSERNIVVTFDDGTADFADRALPILSHHGVSRSPIQVADGMRWFRHKAAGGMAAEDGLRRIANRGRYAGAVT